MANGRGGPLSELVRGASALVGGITFLVRTPGVLGWALVPAGIAVGAALVLSALGLWGVVRFADAFIAGPGAWSGLAQALIVVVLGAFVIFAAAVVALAVAQPLSRFALDRIGARLDDSLGGRALARPVPASSLLASLGVALSALGVTLPAVTALEVATLFAPEAAFITEPIAFAVSALALAWELFDYPFSRRGLGLRDRLRWMKGRFFSILGFAIAAQLLLLIPGLDLFLLPIGIAGATRLFAEGGAKDEAPSSRAASAPALPPHAH